MLLTGRREGVVSRCAKGPSCSDRMLAEARHGRERKNRRECDDEAALFDDLRNLMMLGGALVIMH